VLYRRQAERDGRQPGPLQAFLSTDGSGRYPILVEDGGTVIGWIHDGSFRPLALGHYVELWGYGPAW
jgi:hypothetical protein